MTALAIYSAGRHWVRLFTDEETVADVVIIILPIFVVYAVRTYVSKTSYISHVLVVIDENSNEYIHICICIRIK